MAAKNRSSHIKWKQHSNNLSIVCKELYKSKGSTLTDVIVMCGKDKFPCHRVILSAASDFFKLILREHPPWIQPVITVDDVEAVYMESILNYLYTGTITIDAIKAGNFLRICRSLKIKDLMAYDVVSQDEQTHVEERATITTVEEMKEFVIPPVERVEIETDDDPLEDRPTRIGDDFDDTDSDDLLGFLKGQASNNDETPSEGESHKLPTIGQTISLAVEEDDNYEDDQGNITDSPQASVIEMEVEDSEGSDKEDDISQFFQDSSASRRASQPGPSSANAKSTPKKRNMSCGYSETQLNRSIEVVCRGELSISSASCLYKVPKSVLWRKLQKRPDYVARENKQRVAAKEAMVSGQSMQEVRRKFKVPLATLYRDKQKLVEQGHLGANRPPRDEQEEAMDRAVLACESGMTQSEAARKFKVPKTSLWRRMRTKVN